MDIIPAIDIKDGQCVRLYQGDYQRQTIFDPDPVEVACRWAELGAKRLHVIDLDGAQRGRPVNAQIVFAIMRAVSIPVQLGGGLRDEPTVDAALQLGVDRIMLSASTLADPQLVRRLLDRYDKRIAISLPAHDGWVATNGAMETSHVRARDLVCRMGNLGVQYAMYTDLSREGTLKGPDVAGAAELVALNGPAIFVAGGVGSVSDLQALNDIGVTAVVVGRALYTGAVDLAEALRLMHAGGAFTQ